MALPITFLSDYGLADEFVGVVHGVIAQISPGSRVIDLSHGVPRHDVRGGALMLARSLTYTPAGIHLAVVDPGVGGSRRALALRTVKESRVLVGPDNGLLMRAVDAFGGVAVAVEVSRSPWCLRPRSATVHGRDIFAPVAARLAAGAPLEQAGGPVDPAGLERIAVPGLRRQPDGARVAHVIACDVYGNVQLAVGGLEAAGLRVGDMVTVDTGPMRVQVPCATTFGDVAPGELVLYEDSAGLLALAVNGGDAARRLALSPGRRLRLLPA